MKSTKLRGIMKWIYGCLVFLITAGALCLWTYFAVQFWQSNEPRTSKKETVVEPLHSLKALESSLFYYPFLQKSLKSYRDEKDNGTYVIPGLKVTRTMRAGTDDVCTNMVPQSVCVVKDYLLIGAYCHTKTHYSVIYVLDKRSHEYLKTIVLPGRHHVGGIAYDRVHEMIWISCYDKRAQANTITLQQLEGYNYSLSKRPIAFYEVTDLYTIPKDSFLACYNGYLYVGYFQIHNDSILQKFEIGRDGKLVKQSSAPYQQTYDGMMPTEIAVPVNVATISSKVQGLAFSQYRMYITESYGVMQSKLVMFPIKEDEDPDQNYTNQNAISILNMPQKLEQITVDGEDMYSIYESASYSYRYYSFPSIDRVIKMRVSEVGQFGRQK